MRLSNDGGLGARLLRVAREDRVSEGARARALARALGPTKTWMPKNGRLSRSPFNLWLGRSLTKGIVVSALMFADEPAPSADGPIPAQVSVMVAHPQKVAIGISDDTVIDRPPASIPPGFPPRASRGASAVDPTLAEEVAAIDTIRLEVEEDAYDDALESLARYERRFVRGQLTHEAAHLRTLALTKLRAVDAGSE